MSTYSPHMQQQFTPGVKQAAPLNGHHRRKHPARGGTYLAPNANPPAADLLATAGAPDDLVTDLATWHDLKTREAEQQREASKANAAADAATLDYRIKVRQALESGADPATVKDRTAEHKARAAAHVQFALDAKSARERLGRDLGPRLEQTAPSLFGTVEDRLAETAEVLTGAVAGLRAAWTEHAGVFELRSWLSHVALDGGSIPAWHGDKRLPAGVEDALTQLEHALTELDRLKADEQQVLAYRHANPTP